jgi:hypothetical protein
MKTKEVNEWKVRLRPYWKLKEAEEDKYYSRLKKIEDKMNRELNPPVKLSFHSCEYGNGIGADDLSDRRGKFPLIEFYE